MRVRLNDGTDYTGQLLALDGFMNLAMDDAIEFPDGWKNRAIEVQVSSLASLVGVNSGSEGRRYGQAVIRGNNGGCRLAP